MKQEKWSIILDHLYPSNVIDLMYAGGCLSTDDTKEIEDQTSMANRVKTLVRAILAGTADHVGCFMDRVKDENKDLYQILMHEDQGKVKMINFVYSCILHFEK